MRLCGFVLSGWFCVLLAAAVAGQGDDVPPEPQGCLSNYDCINLACVDGKCVDVCEGACGANMKCTIVETSPSCACTEGFTGDPVLGCTPVDTPVKQFKPFMSPKVSSNSLGAPSKFFNGFLDQDISDIRSRISEIRQELLPLPQEQFTELLEQTARKYFPLQAPGDLCRNHSEYLLDGFLRGEFWAMRMFDASSKLSSGILDGHWQDLGNYEQCVHTDEPEGRFSGLHCVMETEGLIPDNVSAKIRPHPQLLDVFDRDYTFSVCVPSSCSDSDVSRHVDKMLAPLNATVRNFSAFDLGDGFPRLFCTSREPFPYRLKDAIAISIFIALAVAVGVATLCDKRKSKEENRAYWLTRQCRKQCQGLIKSFSLSKNFPSLMDTQAPEREISCLNGLRVLSMLMVITYHRLWIPLYWPTQRYLTITGVFGTVTMGVLELFPKSVDIFFLMGGTLVAYNFCLHRQKGKTFRPLQTIVMRYFRLTPGLAAMALYSGTLFIHSGYGPVWMRTMARVEHVCNKNWWASLLHVSNYAVPEEICVGVSWYTAAYFQLCLLSPLVLLPMCKRPRWGFALLAVCFTASVVGGWTHAYRHSLMSGYFTYSVFGDRTTDINHHMDYVGIHYRASPFLMGLALGYYLCRVSQGESSMKLNKRYVLSGWLISVGVMIALIIVTTELVSPDHKFSSWADPLYVSLSRPLCCAPVAWVILACSLGHGGIINKFLSWSAFRPLGRLTYLVFLVHGYVQYVQIGRMQVPIAFSYLDQIYLLMGDVVLSYLLAVVLYLTVEVPFYKIAYNLLRGRKKSEEITFDMSQPKLVNFTSSS